MASFDPERGCTVVRIVYDGPALAGKTTNLFEVEKAIPAERRGEVYTPGSLKGRTMFFDWLEMDGPVAAETPIKLQLITVPGQVQRNYRRRPLVEMADVVVFVCDSTPDQMSENLQTFGRLKSVMKKRTRPVPLVVQANKQDALGALSPDELRCRLRLDADVLIVAATSSEGVGVRQTLVTAIKLGIKGLSASGTDAMRPEFANPDALFDAMLELEDAPDQEDEDDVFSEHAFSLEEPSPTPPPESVERIPVRREIQYGAAENPVASDGPRQLPPVSQYTPTPEPALVVLRRHRR